MSVYHYKGFLIYLNRKAASEGETAYIVENSDSGEIVHYGLGHRPLKTITQAEIYVDDVHC